jgi:hypothetical protein
LHIALLQVELLQKLKLLKKAITFSQWENGQCDLRRKHAAEELSAIQLMHMTKEMQVHRQDCNVINIMIMIHRY